MIFIDFRFLEHRICFNKISLPFTYSVSRRRASNDRKSTTPHVFISYLAPKKAKCIWSLSLFCRVIAAEMCKFWGPYGCLAVWNFNFQTEIFGPLTFIKKHSYVLCGGNFEYFSRYWKKGNHKMKQQKSFHNLPKINDGAHLTIDVQG